MDLRERIAADADRIRADLERLVALPSIAFAGFPREPLEQAADVVSVTVNLPWPRRVSQSVGSPSFQLPPSQITIVSARISSGSASTTSSSRWRPFSSEPSISTLTLTGGRPSQARSAARWATTPDLSSDAPRPYSRPLRRSGANGSESQPSGGAGWTS